MPGITLVGVGHVFDIGRAVRKVIREAAPQAVCLELDDERLTGLLTKRRTAGVSAGYRALGDFQAKMASKYGTTVGSEMLAAYETAIELGATVYCIDMKASEFFQRAFGAMTFREKISLLSSSVFARFMGKKRIERELEAFEENDAQYLEEFGRKYPSVKRVLIDERNLFMCNAIRTLHSKGVSLVAVVGDGHIDGMSKLLADLSPKVIRLKELRELEMEGASEQDARGGSGNSQVTYSFVQK